MILSLPPKLTHERLRQVDCEFEASLSCLIKIVSKKKKKWKRKWLGGRPGAHSISTIGGLELPESNVCGRDSIALLFVVQNKHV